MSITRIGRYEIERELGRGAMAIVYKAMDPVIGRVVAIKTIRLESALANEQTELRQRLYREAQSAGGLNHSNIVTIYDIGEEGDLSYIAMEYVEGETLEHWMAAHRTPPVDQTVSIIEQIASGLDFAAQRGVIHRDIKPGNILMTPELRVKIADFGIAKLSMSKFTQTGTIMGTPTHMSPEQAMGQELDGRSDIFSVGVIFYEMLTGERPFSGMNPTTIIYKILHQEPVPPRKLNITLHSGYERIVQKMLAKDPAQRFQTCGEVIAALRNYSTFGLPEPQGKIEEKKAPRKKSRLLPVFAVVLLLLGLAGAGFYFYGQGFLSGKPAAPPQETAQTKTSPPAAPAASPIVPLAMPSASSPAKPAGATPEATAPPIASPGRETAAESAAKIAIPPAVTTEIKKSEAAPAPPPKPARAIPANVVLQYSGAQYPVTLFSGRRRLTATTEGGLETEVPSGEHRFRIVNEEFYLDQELERTNLKGGETFSIPVPGLGSAYMEVPNDAFDGCDILLDGRKLPTPYPATVAKVAAGNHRLTFRWSSGKYLGKEINHTLAIGETHHYLVKGDPQSGQVTVHQAR
jgi:tRNA A-37 threonylcarbamoyl transferase component Bud32